MQLDSAKPFPAFRSTVHGDVASSHLPASAVHYSPYGRVNICALKASKRRCGRAERELAPGLTPDNGAPLGRSLHFAKPRFSHLYGGVSKPIKLVGLSCGLNKIMGRQVDTVCLYSIPSHYHHFPESPMENNRLHSYVCIPGVI